MFETSEYEALADEFSEKYGECWELSDLDFDEAHEWMDALYDHYEQDCELRTAFFAGEGIESFYNGKPFEIIERVELGDPDFEMYELPMWKANIGGNTVLAHAGNIFVEE